jgi:hypothetical protein
MRAVVPVRLRCTSAGVLGCSGGTVIVSCAPAVVVISATAEASNINFNMISVLMIGPRCLYNTRIAAIAICSDAFYEKVALAADWSQNE